MDGFTDSAVGAFLSAHPYVSMALFMLGCYVLALALHGAQRGLILAASLLAIPFGLLEFAHIPEYWQPVQPGMAFYGLGDFLFTFSAGGLAIHKAVAAAYVLGLFLANLSGVLLLGVPAEELIWALMFGALWPWFMAYVFDARTA